MPCGGLRSGAGRWGDDGIRAALPPTPRVAARAVLVTDRRQGSPGLQQVVDVERPNCTNGVFHAGSGVRGRCPACWRRRGVADTGAVRRTAGRAARAKEGAVVEVSEGER